MGDLVQTIYKEYAALSKTEKKVADFVILNWQLIPYKTLRQIAEECQSSEPSVLRFIRKIGITSFKDFKREALRCDIEAKTREKENLRNSDATQNTNDSFDYLICQKMPIPLIVQLQLDQYSSLIQKINQTLNYNDVEILAKKILRASHTDFYGVGYSGTVAREMTYRMAKIGLNGRSYQEDRWFLIAESLIDASDVAVGISYSGETSVTVDALKNAKKAGAFTAAITSESNSTITKYADMVVCMPRISSDMQKYSMASCTISMVTMDSLFLYMNILKEYMKTH